MRVTVVGTGASAVHFARTILDRGGDVMMVDVGREGRPPPNVEDSYDDLKRDLDDPAAFFLGERFEGVHYPEETDGAHEVPPARSHLAPRAETGFRSEGFAPRTTHALGGFAQAWEGGVYPYGPEEIVDFPFAHADLAAAYAVVAERIGVSGMDEDLASPAAHPSLLPPLPLDEHSQLLLDRSRERRPVLQRLGAELRRARIAVLSQDTLGRRACALLGRCAWGCPTESIWTPAVLLRELSAHPRFELFRGRRAKWFRVDESRRVRALVVERVDGSGEEEVDVDTLALGAGTLESTRMVLESWRRATGTGARLTGLMDNRQALVPFVSWRMIRRRHDPRSYTYPQVVLGLAGYEPRDHIHAPLATLKAGAIHPFVQRSPFDVRTGLRSFRDLHAATGVATVTLPDHRRRTCWVELPSGVAESEGAEPPLSVHYEAPTGEDALVGRTITRVRRALRALGAIVPPGRSRVRPRGASAQYGGTLPMTREDRPFTTTPDGASRDFAGVYVLDASTFPFLPAKGPAFTLMANAVRIATALR